MSDNKPLAAAMGWTGDPRIKRLIRNGGLLLGGNVGASILTLVSLALAARLLGVEQFGMLALITAYILIVDRLINFQSWHALIKYGAEALASDDIPNFKRLIKLGAIVDGFSAVAVAVIAASGAFVAARFLGWGGEGTELALMYSVVILFHLRGVPTAVLRLFDKFKLLALQQVIVAAVKLAGVAAVFALGGGLPEVVAVWAASEIAGHLLLLWFGLVELKRRNLLDPAVIAGSPFSTENRHFLKFVLATNLEGSLRAFRELDVPVIGLLLTPEAVGLYKIARQVATVVGRVADASFHAVYPELARLAASHDREGFTQLTVRAGAAVGVCALGILGVFLLVGDFALPLLLGQEYRAAYPITVWCMMGMVVWSMAQPLTPGLLSLGGYREMLIVNAGTSLSYPVLFGGMVMLFGLWGAGLALFLFYVCWALIMSKVLLSAVQTAAWPRERSASLAQP